MIIFHHGRWFIVRSPPTLDLIFSKLQDDFLFVLSYQITIMPFIQPPMLVNGNIFLSQLHEYQIGGPDAASQHARVNFIKENATLGQHVSGDSCLEHAVIGQGSIGPTNKPIVAIPSALTMTQKDHLIGSLTIETGKLSLLLLF